jgi:hypothetical protein
MGFTIKQAARQRVERSNYQVEQNQQLIFAASGAHISADQSTEGRVDLRLISHRAPTHSKRTRDRQLLAA